MNHVAGARLTGLGQKAFWVAVAAIVAVMLTWASALSFPYTSGSYPYYEYGDGGMPRPDGIIVQYDPGDGGYIPPGNKPPGNKPPGNKPPGNALMAESAAKPALPVQPVSRGIKYTYKASTQADGSILITRNGVKWVVLANQSHQFLLSDPNGTGHTVVKMFGFPAAGPIKAVKLRDSTR